MLSYKQANAVFNWTPNASTSVLGDGTEAGVVIHEDHTFVHIRDGGKYVTQFSRNSTHEDARLRSFTGDTIPFSVLAYQTQSQILMQDILLDAYNLFHNFIYFNDRKPESLSEELARTKQEVQAMSSSTEVIKELQVKGLASFTAYANHAIKVVFEDRTIVRMQQGQELIKVLSKNGEELVFSIHSIARN